MQWQKPILIGGVTLSLGLWGLDSLHHTLGDLSDILTLGILAAGGGYWWLYRQGKKSTPEIVPTVNVSRQQLDKLLNQAQIVINQLLAETADNGIVNQLKSQLVNIEAELNRPERRIAVTGGQKVGKTSLINQLEKISNIANVPLQWLETPPLFTIDASQDQPIKNITDRADLVLFVITGDLTATEYQYLENLAKNERVLLVLNKNDQFLPDELTLIISKIQSVLKNILTPSDIIDVSVDPALIKVRKLQADGTSQETIEQPPVMINSLTQKVEQIIKNEAETLLWASTYRQVNSVKIAAKEILNQRRQAKAIPAIEQYQWIAATTAFANPLPALDLLAIAAINAQMIVDLGNIYQQKFTLDQAQAIAKTMGEVMLKLGVVELVTQTISNILKTNALTYIAGGFIQGVSSAYLTNIAGLAMIEYFAAQDVVTPTTNNNWNSELMSSIVANLVKNNQRIDYLKSLVQQGIDRLLSDENKPRFANN